MSSSKHIVLFLAANQLGTTELALDENARAIQQELEGSEFELVMGLAVRPLGRLGLRKFKPTIVNFSRYGRR